MATTTPKKLYGGTLTNSSATLYTVPALTTTVITSITICNKTASSTTLTLVVDGTSLWSGATVGANETWTVGPQDMRQVLTAAATITGLAGANSALDVRISGAEIA